MPISAIASESNGRTSAGEFFDDDPTTYKTFPSELLPNVLADFIDAIGREMVCDRAYVALPALAATAGAIGSSRVLRVKQNWRVPAILWTVTVGKSGSVKTPPAHQAARYLLEHDRELREHDKRCACGDVTLESLCRILADNTRGLLVFRDELNGWLNSFEQYSRGSNSGGGMAGWLELYRGTMPIVDRKSDKTHVASNKTAVSITGTIQPDILRRALSDTCFESGLSARLLLANPPSSAKTWNDFEADEAVDRRYGAMLDTLLRLDRNENGYPVELILGPDAKSRYIKFYEANALQTHEADSRLAAAFAKLEETPLRLALVLHLAEYADARNRDEATPDMFSIGADTMARAIALTQWFKNETRRIYLDMARSQADRELLDLRTWILERGGRIKVRECQMSYHPFRSQNLKADQVERVLSQICDRATEGRETWFVLKGE